MYWSKGKADLEQDTRFKDAGFYIRMPDGAQEHGIELLEFSDRAVRKRLTGLQVPGGAEVERGEFELEPALACCGIDDLYRFFNDLGSGPVTGDQCDLVGLCHE